MLSYYTSPINMLGSYGKWTQIARTLFFKQHEFDTTSIILPTSLNFVFFKGFSAVCHIGNSLEWCMVFWGPREFHCLLVFIIQSGSNFH